MCGHGPPLLETGDRARFVSYGLGKIENAFLDEEGVQIYGRGEFEIVRARFWRRKVTIRNAAGKEGEVLRNWLEPVRRT